jgi:hypothetical protein
MQNKFKVVKQIINIFLKDSKTIRISVTFHEVQNISKKKVSSGEL